MIKFSKESKIEIARMTTLIFFCLFEIITLSLALFMTSIKIEFAKKCSKHKYLWAFLPLHLYCVEPYIQSLNYQEKMEVLRV